MRLIPLLSFITSISSGLSLSLLGGQQPHDKPGQRSNRQKKQRGLVHEKTHGAALAAADSGRGEPGDEDPEETAGSAEDNEAAGSSESSESSESSGNEPESESSESSGNESEVAARHEEEVHNVETDTSDAVAVMLLGMTTFFVALFYMVNYPGKTVRGFTWSMMSAAVSIFGAVLIWTVVLSTVTSLTMDAEAEESGELSFFLNPLTSLMSKKGHGKLLHEREGRAGHEEGPNIFVLVCLFLSLYAIFQIILMQLWSRPGALDIFATIGGHTLGFAAAQTVATVGAEEPWCTSPLSYFGFCVLAGILLLGCISITTQIRKRTIAAWGVVVDGADVSDGNADVSDEDVSNMSDTEKKEYWAHICEHSENEFVAFAVGLVLTLCIQYTITGELPYFHGNPYNHTSQETSLMFAASLVFAFGLLLCIRMEQGHTIGHRTFHMLEANMSFSFGWCFLFSCRCLYWGSTDDYGFFKGDQMTARVIQAITLSLVTFIVIVLLKGSGDRGWLTAPSVKLLMASFGLMLGLSWEGAFGQALEVVAEAGENAGGKLSTCGSDLLGLTVCVIVLPAWAFFILPNAKEGVENLHENAKERLAGLAAVAEGVGQAAAPEDHGHHD